MYGTTMIATLAAGVDAAKVRTEVELWEKEHHPVGYRSSHVLIGDDGRTIVNVAIFDSKESYQALADNPAQDAWWQKHYAPLLEGEPRWIDGRWIS
jgi:hypothetical protein